MTTAKAADASEAKPGSQSAAFGAVAERSASQPTATVNHGSATAPT